MTARRKPAATRNDGPGSKNTGGLRHMLNRRSLIAAMATLLAAPTQASMQPVTIFAAASLKNALDSLLQPLSVRAHIKARCVYAASSALARQLEQGAPADLFWSADREWMEWCAERQLIRRETMTDFLGNRLVVIAPADKNSSPLDLTIAGFDNALGAGRIAMGETRSVPAGRYAKEALQSLGLWQHLSARLAETDNVRAALLLVARAETPLGIVYASDASAEKRVKIIAEFPTATHKPIIYPVAMTKLAQTEPAAAMMRFFGTQTARDIFINEGFSVLKEPPPA